MFDLNLAYGSSLVEHCLMIAGFPDKCIIGKNFNREAGFLDILFFEHYLNEYF
jgi:hypothetical protein